MAGKYLFDYQLYAEALGYLSEFIKIRSINPPGNEMQALEFLQGIFSREGLDTKLYESVPGRGVLICRIPGKLQNEKSIVLLNHVDVVGADAEYWDVDPFGGIIKDDYIWGRGALDMKSFGIMQLAVMLLFMRHKIVPDKDLIFLAVSDEERLGTYGAAWAVNNIFIEINPAVVLNEGAYGLENVLIKEPVFCIEVAQKSSLRVRMLAVDKPGHSNAPGKRSSITNLIKALNRLADYEFPLEVHPITAELFKRMSVKKTFPENMIMANLTNPICTHLMNKQLRKDKVLNAHLKNTVAITVLKAGEAHNAIPPTAEAVIDIRYMPSEDPQNLLKKIKQLIGDDTIAIEPLTEIIPNSATSFETNEFRIIEEELLKAYPESIVTPYLDIGGSDSKHFRLKGVDCYGIIPVIITKDELNTIHGNNERLSIESFNKGIDITFNIAKRLCAK